MVGVDINGCWSNNEERKGEKERGKGARTEHQGSLFTATNKVDIYLFTLLLLFFLTIFGENNRCLEKIWLQNINNKLTLYTSNPRWISHLLGFTSLYFLFTILISYFSFPGLGEEKSLEKKGRKKIGLIVWEDHLLVCIY